MIISPARTKDAAAISALIQYTIRISNRADYPPDDIEETCANFSPENVLEKMATRDVFVGRVEDRLVGTVSFDGSKLHSLFVNPDDQGRGYGKVLAHHVEYIARSRGCLSIAVSSSLTARGFYASLSYSDVEFQQRPFGSTWLMNKILAL